MTRLLTVLVTVTALAILVKLGLWQLQRAEQKQHLSQQYALRGQQQLTWPLPQGDLRGFGVSVDGRWLAEHSLLLDNQVHQGQVGYRWLVPVEVKAEQPWLLVDLGFIASGVDRRQLPALPALPQRSLLQGKLLQPGHNRLADQLLPEAGVVTRVQALNWQQLQAYWQHPLVPALLWLEQPQQLGFVRPWQPLNMGADKHRAYALQWFSLAAALLIIVGVMWRRSRAVTPA